VQGLVARKKPQSCRSSTTHPSPSDNHDLLQTSRVFPSGVSCFPIPIFLRSNFSQSPQIYVACPPQINGSFPSFNIHFRPPCHYGPILLQELYKIYMLSPRAPSAEDTWHPSVRDTWHPSSTDTWHSFQAFLDMSSSLFLSDTCHPSSTTCQHSDMSGHPVSCGRSSSEEMFLFKCQD
jgi:hypothetical protein